MTDSVSRASNPRVNGDPYCGPYIYKQKNLSWNMLGTVDESVVRFDGTDTFEVEGTNEDQCGLYDITFEVYLDDYEFPAATEFLI